MCAGNFGDEKRKKENQLIYTNDIYKLSNEGNGHLGKKVLKNWTKLFSFKIETILSYLFA